MESLQEIKATINELVEQASDTDMIQKLSCVNKLIGDVETQQAAKAIEYDNLLKEYKKMSMHTSIGSQVVDKQENYEEPVSLEESLLEFLKNKK